MNNDEKTDGIPSILYVFDQDAGAHINWPKRGRLFLAPMTVDKDLIEGIKDSARHLGRTSTVDFADLFHQTAFAVRERFIEFVSVFGDVHSADDTPLKEIFFDGRQAFSSWWLTPIAVKNTVVTTSFNRLVCFLTIIDIQRRYNCDEIWLDIADHQLARGFKANADRLAVKFKPIRSNRFGRNIVESIEPAARGLLQLLKLAAKATTARWTMRGVDPGLEKARYLMVSYFPLVDQEALAAGRFICKYYSPLQQRLEEKYPDRVAWLAMFVPLDNHNWSSSLTLGRGIAGMGHAFSFIEQWLTVSDLAAVAVRTAASILSFIRRRGALETAFAFRDKDRYLNIWPLFEVDWRDSFYGPGFIMGQIYRLVFQRVLSQLQPGATIVYTAEMLAWERALNIASRGREDLKVVGVQHTTVPLLLLNYFNHPNEFRGRANIESLPQPDYLACVGRTTQQFFLDCGWDPKKVFIWGAIRFQHLKSYLANPVDWSARENKIIIALSISPAAGGEILRLAYHAFTDKMDYRVIVKGHPGSPVRPLLESMGIELRPDVFSVSEEPLPELLARAKALIVAESSAALEGIACGCPVIVPRLPGLLDLNPLSGISDLPIYAVDPAGLKQVADQIVGGDRSPLREEDCRRFIEEYCSFPDSDEEFLTVLENLNGGERKAAAS